MGNPFTSVSVSGYNANPPADDGSATAANTVFWSTIKSKLADTLKTAIEAINTNNLAAFTKIIGGGGVSSTAVDYTVLGSDQGKLVRGTASGITITTPDATAVLSPFVFGVLNNSGGTITLDGSGTQTIDGNLTLTIPAGGGTLLFTDGSNWFSTGIQGVFVGKQLMYGDIINGTIVESNATNAVTFAVKTLAGADPSTADPVLLCFRNPTVGTGNYAYRSITAALSLTISSGSTMGFSSGVPGKLWLVLFDDAGTIRLGAVNCLSGTSIYPLGRMPIASSTAEGGAGAADSAHVIYTGTAVAAKSYLILGYAAYESGVATAGSWNASPTRIQLYGPGVPLPGDVVQTQATFTGAATTGTTAIPNDNSIPQNTEGDQYMSQPITPSSGANVLKIESKGHFAATQGSSSTFIMALFQDSNANALAVTLINIANNNVASVVDLVWRMLAGTSSATTLKIRAGDENAGTTTFNGSGGSQKFNGTLASYLSVDEIMA